MSLQRWGNTLDGWSVGPRQTEAEKCANAERMVREALSEYEPFGERQIRVFLQGSYRNRTNVRAESDVDVGILCLDTFYPDFELVPHVSLDTLGIAPARYKYPAFRDDVQAALEAKFGGEAVRAGDKAFNLKGNSYRVSIDVVPVFEGRLYYGPTVGEYHAGTAFATRSGKLIRNWPEQHYANGVEKHSDTSRQFKKKVRCLKNLCNWMKEKNIASAQNIPSFLLESLVYNCPSYVFREESHYEDLKQVISFLWEYTLDDEHCQKWLEVNGIKFLFHSSQPWTRAAVHQFLDDAWDFIGFE